MPEPAGLARNEGPAQLGCRVIDVRPHVQSAQLKAVDLGEPVSNCSARVGIWGYRLPKSPIDFARMFAM